MSSLAEWSRRLALLAVSSGVGFGVVEGAVRWRWPDLLPRYGTFEITAAGPFRTFRLAPDPSIGWRMPSNRRFLIRDAEFESLVESNDQGFRSSRPQRDDAPDAPVVAVIGDSVTEAVQVTEAQTFVKGLEARLAGRWVRADNYGVSSFGYPHYLAVYRHDVARHRPRVVVIVTFLVNDLADSATETARIPALRPRYALDSSGAVTDLLPFQGPAPAADSGGLRRLLRDHCATYRLLRSIDAGQLRAPTAGRFGGLEERFVSPWSPGLERDWRGAAWCLQTLVGLARTAGARVALVALPGEDTGSDAAWRSIEARSSGALDRELLSRRLAELSAQLGIAYRDLSPEFRESYRAGRRLHLEKDGHLNAIGHEVVAAALAPLVEAELREAAGGPISR